MGARTHLRKTIVAGLFGDNGLACIDIVVAFVTSSKFLNQCFADSPDDIKFKSYIGKHIIHLLWLNVTAG